MGNDLIRMSGMNSGLDTESIINALTANSKLKITKQERNVMKYEETQKAYQDITSKMTALKDKYFNLLNNQNNLSGSSMWNKYASKTYLDGTETAMAGFSAQTTVNSQPGEYTMKVKSNAKQATMKGGSLSSNAKITQEELNAFENNREYGFTIDVAGTTKNVTFRGGATAGDTLNNINQALEDAYGESNESVGDSGTEGMVFVDPDTLQFSSRDGKGMTVSGIGTLTSSNSIDLSSAVTGNNSLTFQVGDETVNVSFQTLKSDYFDKAITNGFINAAGGDPAIPRYTIDPDDLEEGQDLSDFKNPEWTAKIHELAVAEAGEGASDEDIVMAEYKVEADITEATYLYKSVVDDYKESVRYDSYKAWAETATDADWQRLYDYADGKQQKQKVTGWLNGDSDVSTAYNTYKDSLDEGVEADSIYDWAKNNTDTAIKAKYEGFVNRYNGTDESETELKDQYAIETLSAESKAAYETYKSGVPEGDPVMSLGEWADSDATASSELANAETSYAEWLPKHIEDHSWHLNKSMFLDPDRRSESQTFAAYKDSGEFDEAHTDFGITKDKILRHYTESSLKNSIGNLETPGGVKFDVSLGNDGKASISAYKETTAEDGTTTRTDVNFSVTAGRDSANNFGVSTASTNISQISNTTKLSDLGLTADSDGKYGFTINGKSFSFDESTTVNDMMKTINASSAGVKMTYSSLDNAFTMTASKYGIDSEIKITGDDQGLMSAIGLSGTAKNGSNLVVEINGKTYESAGNSIEADGTTFSFTDKAKLNTEFTVNIEKDTSAIADVIKNFVKDYNQLIEDVYKYLDEKPEKDYYFLTDADKEDLDLSEKQEEKWEEKAKKGLLYHDSTVTTAMNQLRTALMGAVEGYDGNMFSLSSVGLKTQSDYNKHGMFADINDDTLKTAIEGHSDDIMKLFTDSENGIMKKFSEALDATVGTTGPTKGTLVRKAGLKTGTSSTDNEIYRTIKRTKQRIAALTTRYEGEQDRLWKRYSNMESLLGGLNNQQASFASYFMQG